MNTGKVVVGIITAAAVGTVLGILFAPDKGSVTRKNISNSSEEAIADLKAKFKDFLDGLTRSLETVQSDVDGLVSQGKSKLDHIGKKADEMKA